MELLAAAMRHYQQVTGRRLAAGRVTAWHLRTPSVMRSGAAKAGIPLPDHRTPAAWIDDLSARFSRLGIEPETPPATGEHR